MSISAAYADLGGGLATAARAVSPLPAPQAPPVCSHMFDQVSGWCGCGLRDDGAIAPGSPAWRATVERTMPGARS